MDVCVSVQERETKGKERETESTSASQKRALKGFLKQWRYEHKFGLVYEVIFSVFFQFRLYSCKPIFTKVFRKLYKNNLSFLKKVLINPISK